MTFADELDQMHADCLDTANGFGIAATLTIPRAGELDTTTGTRAGADQNQDITVSATPTVRQGRSEQCRVWCRAEDVTLGDGVPQIGWKFTVFERTWTVTAVERDANETGFWLTGEASAA